MSNKQFVGDLQPVEPRIPFEVRHKPVPGPGAYEIRDEMGPRALRATSPRPSNPVWSLSKQSKEMKSNCLTKNVDFILKPSMGRIPDSTKTSYPTWGFGTSTRDKRSLCAPVSPRSPRSYSPRDGSSPRRN